MRPPQLRAHGRLIAGLRLPNFSVPQTAFRLTRFAAKANFKLNSEKIDTDLAGFVTDYIEQIARVTSGTRMRVQVENGRPGLKMRFNPIDASIIVDNLISNANRLADAVVRPQVHTQLPMSQNRYDDFFKSLGIGER